MAAGSRRLFSSFSKDELYNEVNGLDIWTSNMYFQTNRNILYCSFAVRVQLCKASLAKLIKYMPTT